MTYDSSDSSDIDITTKIMKTPARATVNFLTQFARVYNHLECKRCQNLIAN